MIDDALIQRWTTRGRKPALGTHDAFFMTLLYLRNYSTFLELGRCFHLKENTAKDTVQRVLMAIHDPLFNALVRPLGKTAQLAEGKLVFNSRHYVYRFSPCCSCSGLHVSNQQQNRCQFRRSQALLLGKTLSVWHKARACPSSKWYV